MPKYWFACKYIFVFLVHQTVICFMYMSNSWHSSAHLQQFPSKAHHRPEDTTFFVLLMFSENSGLLLFFEDALIFTENMPFCYLWMWAFVVLVLMGWWEGSEMKVLASKSDNLISIPRACMAEERMSSYRLSSGFHSAPRYTCPTHIPTQINGGLFLTDTG